jgi:hypothetical protein
VQRYDLLSRADAETLQAAIREAHSLRAIVASLKAQLSQAPDTAGPARNDAQIRALEDEIERKTGEARGLRKALEGEVRVQLCTRTHTHTHTRNHCQQATANSTDPLNFISSDLGCSSSRLFIYI